MGERCRCPMEEQKKQSGGLKAKLINVDTNCTMIDFKRIFEIENKN